MTVTFGRRAADQLARIFAHVAESDPNAAARIVERIQDIASTLDRFPERGKRTRRDPRLRWLAVPGLPCLVFYTIRLDGTIRIIRVLHGARQRHRP